MNQLTPHRSALPGTTGATYRPHQSTLRKARVSLPGHCYFITTTIANREPLMANAPIAKVIVGSLFWLQEQNRIRLMGFVIMPDHLHMAFVLPEESRPEGRSYECVPAPIGAPFRARPSLSHVMESFKGYTGKTINELINRHGPVWQSAYHDHLVRDRKDFETRLNYMHDNPVRKGLAHFEDEFTFSTASPWYTSWIDWAWLDGIEYAKSDEDPVRARKGAPTEEQGA